MHLACASYRNPDADDAEPSLTRAHPVSGLTFEAASHEFRAWFPSASIEEKHALSVDMNHQKQEVVDDIRGRMTLHVDFGWGTWISHCVVDVIACEPEMTDAMARFEGLLSDPFIDSGASSEDQETGRTKMQTPEFLRSVPPCSVC